MNVVLHIDQAELTAWPIAPGALLIAGRAGQAVPAAGVAQLERRRGDRGPFRCLSWPLEDGSGGSGFIAAVRLPQSVSPIGGQALVLEDQAGGNLPLRLPDVLSGPQDLVTAVVGMMPGNAPAGAALARFMFATFPASAMQRLPVIGKMLAGMLAGLAIDDGCIELMGAIPGVCGFLQGWGGPVVAEARAADGGVEALLVGGQVTRTRLRIATFARPDIVSPASGTVLVVADLAAPQSADAPTAGAPAAGAPTAGAPTAGAPAAANTPIAGALASFSDLEQVYLVTETAVLRRALVDRRLLSPADSAGHIRDMLPALSCPPAAADCLRRALRPRYDGRDTLGEQALPVRAAVDQALLLPAEDGLPAGIYVGGWLFDPTRLVSEVTVRDPMGFEARLDAGWTRIPRADVTQALTAAGFPAPADDAHGFAAYAPGKGRPGDSLYLDIAFRDGTCAFLPITATSAYDVAARTRVLDGTDLHKPSGIAVVERQLGPLWLALMRRRPARAATPVAPGAGNAPLNLGIVVTLVGKPAQPRSLLSQFLHDPLAADEALILVCGPAWDDGALAGLRRTTAFMGLNAQVLAAPGATDAAAALDIAAEHFAAQSYLLLDAATAGCQPGWRQALRAAAGPAEAVAVFCPTLVYEDLSIRYAGAGPMTTQPVAPYVAVSRNLAGMPVALAGESPPRPTTLGTLACCLIPRAVLAALGGARSHLATPFGQETEFFLRLRSAGIACAWVPRARVYAPDALPEAPQGGQAAATVGGLVDGWCLRAAQESGLFVAKPSLLSKRAEG